MFAITTSNLGYVSSLFSSPTEKFTSDFILFSTAFSLEIRIASSSISMPKTGLKPSLLAVNEIMPEPHPKSSRDVLLIKLDSIFKTSSKHNLVVS